MPEMRSFTVTQTREVKVSANTVEDAARIAERAFAEGQTAGGHLPSKEGLFGIWGDTSSRVREIELNVKEGR